MALVQARASATDPFRRVSKALSARTWNRSYRCRHRRPASKRGLRNSRQNESTNLYRFSLCDPISDPTRYRAEPSSQPWRGLHRFSVDAAASDLDRVSALPVREQNLLRSCYSTRQRQQGCNACATFSNSLRTLCILKIFRRRFSSNRVTSVAAHRQGRGRDARLRLQLDDAERKRIGRKLPT